MPISSYTVIFSVLFFHLQVNLVNKAGRASGENQKQKKKIVIKVNCSLVQVVGFMSKLPVSFTSFIYIFVGHGGRTYRRQ